MIFYVQKECFAFENEGNKLHYEFCKADYKTYRSDDRQLKQLRKRYHTDCFLVVPMIDFEDIMHMFVFVK